MKATLISAAAALTLIGVAPQPAPAQDPQD